MNIILQRSLIAGFAAVALSSCAARPIDLVVTGAVPVPGVPNQYWMCLESDPGTALFFTQLPGSVENEFDFLVYDHAACMERFGIEPAPVQDQPSVNNQRSEVEDFGLEDED